MNRILLAAALIITLFSCGNDDNGNINDNNPFLNAPPVNVNLNLNLPQFNPLRFPGNSVILNSQGIKGIVVYNVNNDLYTAFELSDPNHPPSSCSKMEIEGIIATCPCADDDNSYDIVTGQHQSDPDAFPMLFYRVERNGENIIISN